MRLPCSRMPETDIIRIALVEAVFVSTALFWPMLVLILSLVALSKSNRALREIAELKLKDLTAHTVEQGMKIIEGTARSAGIKVV